MAIKYTFVPERNVKVIKYLNRSIISVMEGIYTNCVLDIEISPLHFFFYCISLTFFHCCCKGKSFYFRYATLLYSYYFFHYNVYIRNKFIYNSSALSSKVEELNGMYIYILFKVFLLFYIIKGKKEGMNERKFSRFDKRIF